MRLNGLAPLFAFCCTADDLFHRIYRCFPGRRQPYAVLTYLPFTIHTVQKTNYSFLTKN